MVPPGHTDGNMPFSVGLKPNPPALLQSDIPTLPNPPEFIYLGYLLWALRSLVSSKRVLFWQERGLLLPFAEALLLEVCKWILNVVTLPGRQCSFMAVSC